MCSTVALMSARDQLAKALQDIPESASLQEAFDRLYAAFREKLRREAAQDGAVRTRPFGLDVGRGSIASDFDAPLPDEILRGFTGE